VTRVSSQLPTLTFLRRYILNTDLIFFLGFSTFSDPITAVNKVLNNLDLNCRYLYDTCEDAPVVLFRYGRLTFPTKEAFCKFIASKTITYPELDFYLVTILQMPNFKQFIYEKARDYVSRYLRVASGSAVFKNARLVIRQYTQNIGAPGVGPNPNMMTVYNIIDLLVQHTHSRLTYTKISLKDLRSVFPNFETMVENCTLTPEMIEEIKQYAYVDSLMPESVCAVFLSSALPPQTGLTTFSIADDFSQWRDSLYLDPNEPYIQCILSLAEYLMDVLCGAIATSHVCDVRYRNYDYDDPLYTYLANSMNYVSHDEPTLGAFPPELDAACMVKQMIRPPPTVAEERDYYRKLRALLHMSNNQDSDLEDEVDGADTIRNPLAMVDLTRVRYVGENNFFVCLINWKRKNLYFTSWG
jgi:hypothetical protein